MNQERVIGIQGEILELLKGQLPLPKLSEYLVNISRRHYQVHEAQAIGKQILMAEKLSEQTVALDGEEKPEEGGDEITVVARDEPGLFAKICGVLTANLLNILSAQISTWGNGIAVDQFRVRSLIEEGLLQPLRWAKLQGDLKKVLEGKVEVDRLLQEVVPPLFHRYATVRSAPQVEVDNVTSDFYTLVEVFTHDRPGHIGESWRKRSYPAHFVSKLTDADAETTETAVWLDLSLACKYLDETIYADLSSEYAEIGKMLGAMITTPEKFCYESPKRTKGS